MYLLFNSTDDDKFELTVVNPGTVIGPIIGNNVGTSVEVCLLITALVLLAILSPYIFYNGHILAW